MLLFLLDIHTPQPRIPMETEGLGVKGLGSFAEIHKPPLAAGPENPYESTVGKDDISFCGLAFIQKRAFSLVYIFFLALTILFILAVGLTANIYIYILHLMDGNHLIIS